jgi:hypothetical protein
VEARASPRLAAALRASRCALLRWAKAPGRDIISGATKRNVPANPLQGEIAILTSRPLGSVLPLASTLPVLESTGAVKAQPERRAYDWS